MATRKGATPPEKLTKAALLEGLGRKLSKDELVSLFKAVSHGYSPYTGRNLEVGEAPGWFQSK